MATSDPIAEIIGDYRAFAAMQRDRLVARGIDIAPYPLSHLAVRVADWDLYVLEPVYVLFEDFTHVKFYRRSLYDAVQLQEGRRFDGFSHVDDWVPQRLVTATGPNPLPR